MPELMNSIVIYMFVGDTVDGALLWHGKIQSGAHGFACDFGNMSFHFGDILENRVSGCTSFDDLIQILACAIYNIIIVIDPKAIMLECEIPYDPGVVIASVKTLCNITINCQRCEFQNLFSPLQLSAAQIRVLHF